jgi:YbgC/YbaW family acyl-CoA thioester hydrolase
MSDMDKFPSSIKTIRFQDCDPLGHLNNGRYFDYFMNAREDHLSEYYDLNIYDELKKESKTWVVAKSEILYRKPAFLMENVLIKTQLNNFSIKHIEVEMSMYNEDGSKLKALLRTVFIPFEIKSNQAIEHDDDLMSLLKEVRVEGITSNIEERVIELQGKLSTV